MKFINKLLIVAVVFMIASCDMTDLDLLDNPNEVAPENANVDDLFNRIQLDFGDHIVSMWDLTAGMSRMVSTGGAFDYTSATNPNFFNFLWTNAYADIFPDIAALEAIASERGLDFHSGASKIMKAYVLTSMVDLFGDIPNSQAGDGTNTIAPMRDSGADVYAAADALLVQAIAQLTGTTATAPINDLAYGGDAAKWVTLAKSMQLRNAVTTRLANPSANATVAALIAEGDLISDSGNDFQVQYGNTRLNPQSRHPNYYNMYEANDGDYMSNYYMWLLRADKTDADEEPVVDPRIRYYFYRKTGDAVGLDPNVYSCHFSNLPDQSAQPAHYADIDPRLPYCVAWEDGYFGRDHLNAEGIPPDGPFRTAYGIYPAGGQFDDNSFSETQEQGTTGGLGQGIEPILLASFVDFLRAEAALTMGTGEDAKALLESGMRKSIEKVQSFSSLSPADFARGIEDAVTGETNTVEDLFVPTAEDVDAYIAFVLAAYDAADADGKLDIVMKEYYIALWGNGLEAYNMYRRTGKPNNMAPALEPGPGAFIRSFFLPGDHVNFNANADQKTLTMPVFWDTNPDGFVY